MKESIFQMESMLISHMNQKSARSAIFGIFQIKTLARGHIFVMDAITTQKCNELKNIAIIRIKKTVYRICFLFMSKRKAKKLMVNSNLTNKKGFL